MLRKIKGRNFKRIELFSLDPYLTDRLCLKLEEKLKSIPVEAKYVSSNDSMLSQLLRVIKTYNTVKIDNQTQCFLEAAREYQNQVENIHHIEKNGTVIITNNSYLMNTGYWLFNYNVKVSKVINKFLIRKIAIIPDLIYFINIDVKKVINDRKYFDDMHKAEINFRGNRINTLQDNYITTLKQISNKFGPGYVILNSVEVDDETIIDQILQDLLDRKFFLNEGV